MVDTMLLLLMLLLLMKLALGDKWRREMVDAVVLGEGGCCIWRVPALDTLASASSSEGTNDVEPARLMRGFRTLMAIGCGAAAERRFEA